jgi:hypothetical protein
VMVAFMISPPERSPVRGLSLQTRRYDSGPAGQATCGWNAGVGLSIMRLDRFVRSVRIVRVEPEATSGR